VTLKPEDAAWLIARTTTDKTVLIGGQAVSFWARYFGIASRLSALTRDIDYFGTKAEASLVASRLKVPHSLRIATLDDATPNAAVLLVSMEGYPDPIIIDYLASIIGVRSAAIQKSAVTVEIDGQKLRVLHPLQLLRAKIWNLYKLEEKRTLEGIEQARLSIEIAAAYVKEANTTQRTLLDSVEMIARFAATAPARFAKDHFQLQCLKAIPESAFDEGALPREFHGKRWPQLLKAIE